MRKWTFDFQHFLWVINVKNSSAMLFRKLNFASQLFSRTWSETASPISVIMSSRPLLSFYFKFNFASKNCVSDSSEVKTASLTDFNLQFLFNEIFHDYYKDSCSFQLTLTGNTHDRLRSILYIHLNSFGTVLIFMISAKYIHQTAVIFCPVSSI